jgi:hypothetical protein
VANDNDEQAGDFGPYRELLVLIPLVGTALAVAFDVGYFTGVDINFFTFFSLSEHIVFALEVLPAALAGAVFISFCLFYLTRPVHLHGRRTSRPLVARWFISVPVAGIAVFLSWDYLRHHEFLYLILNALSALFAVIAIVFTKRPFVTVILGCSAALIFAFGLGYAAG